MIKPGKRMAVAAIIAAAAAAAVPVGTASAATTGHHSPASPNTYGQFLNDVRIWGVAVRSGPGLGYPVIRVLNPLQFFWDGCYTAGTTIYGNPYWDFVWNSDIYLAGYVSEYYLTDQSQTEHCSSL